MKTIILLICASMAAYTAAQGKKNSNSYSNRIKEIFWSSSNWISKEYGENG